MQRIEDRRLKYQNEGYRPCRPFMLRGGIHGRSTRYPWRAYRIRRIFRRVIRTDSMRDGQALRQRTANALAFRQSPMVPVFAYQWRIPRVLPRAPRPTRKQLTIQRHQEPQPLKRAA
jgi:hypothetical protein